MGGRRGTYKVVRCGRCGWLQVTTAEKAARCVRCGSSIDLSSTAPLALARSAEEAREALLRLKARALGKLMRER